jgi:hypothetical protein
VNEAMQVVNWVLDLDSASVQCVLYSGSLIGGDHDVSNLKSCRDG